MPSIIQEGKKKLFFWYVVNIERNHFYTAVSLISSISIDLAQTPFCLWKLQILCCNLSSLFCFNSFLLAWDLVDKLGLDTADVDAMFKGSANVFRCPFRRHLSLKFCLTSNDWMDNLLWVQLPFLCPSLRLAWKTSSETESEWLMSLSSIPFCVCALSLSLWRTRLIRTFFNKLRDLFLGFLVRRMTWSSSGVMSSLCNQICIRRRKWNKPNLGVNNYINSDCLS